jgi:[acyl-carrier-protein] S-malonyltransferase
MCFSGDEADLQLTANTQPAILTASVAAFHAARAEGLPDPTIVAGHSLGEYSALVAAGVLDLADAVRTVRKRGTYMQEAVPVGVGAMAAILGLDVDAVEAGCAEAAEGQVCSPANINSPSQVVIAGNAEAVDRACEILKGKGAKRAIKLNVSAPFHCGLMMPAQEKLAADLGTMEYSAFDFPIVHNVDAAVNDDPAVVADRLVRQVSSPVRWLGTLESMSAAGVTKFIEIGPGKVLTGLVRQSVPGAEYGNIENAESLGNTLGSL